MTRLYIPVAVRWSDLDAYQHVNNVEMFRLLEEARISAFWRHPLDAGRTSADDPGPTGPNGPGGSTGVASWPTAILGSGPDADSHTFVVHQEIEYLRPLGFTRVPVLIEMWLGKLGSASLEICYEVHDGGSHPFSDRLTTDRPHLVGPGSGAKPYVRASTTIVLVDAATSAPRRIRPQEREIWQDYVEEPMTFRKR